MDPERMRQGRAASVQKIQEMTMESKTCSQCPRMYALSTEASETFARITCKWSDCDYAREYHR